MARRVTQYWVALIRSITLILVALIWISLILVALVGVALLIIWWIVGRVLILDIYNISSFLGRRGGIVLSVSASSTEVNNDNDEYDNKDDGDNDSNNGPRS